MEYPVIHGLDGVYFRIKRDNEYHNICFSDLTEEEKNNVMNGRTVDWLKSMCTILGDTIHKIGEQFDIYTTIGDKEEK